MAISAGRQIGPYEVLALLGAGGMGEVYRAHDTRLDREVAIKFLPADFAHDVERLKRFEQEARATSALNHPNILTVHDIGTHEGQPFIVEELLDGEELRAQLNEGAIAPKKVLEYARQIADGLAAAHDKGIVHRDLKPENLFVTKDGRVKILDFGLAKLKPQKLTGSVDSEAPTMKPLTNPGVIMGTVGYMSPEQVRGLEADHRSDIFSFGIILHEMLSGQRTFAGDSLVELMNAILKEDPAELSETNMKISPALDKIVRRCLEKKPERRFQSASDLGFALGTLSSLAEGPSGARLETATAVTESAAVSTARWFGNARLWMITTAVLLLGLLLSLPFAVKYLRQSPPVEPVAVRFTIAAPEKIIGLGWPEISPDGRNLLFNALDEKRSLGLWLRPLGSLTAQRLPGTENSGIGFWSPDSRSICFVADGKLKKLDLAGGVAQTLCAQPGTRGPILGGTWNRDGVILFNAGGIIYRVPATGGEPTLVLGTEQPNREAFYRCPIFLPDGRHFLYLRTPTQQGASEIYLASLDGKETTRLLAADSHARYVATAMGSGYLLFARNGALLAQPFDASKLKLAGEPSVVADKVKVADPIGRGYFSVSDNGSLVYDPISNVDNQQLVWVDRAGKQMEAVGTPGGILTPRLSPDGKRVAVVRQDTQTRTSDIYVIDLARGTSSRLTFDPGNDSAPVWSPDGSRIAWQASRDRAFQLYQKLASGVGQEELLLKLDSPIIPGSWSGDGRFILYYAPGGANTGTDLWVLPLEGERKPFLFLQTPFDETQGRFSPDGRWIAYVSNDQGRREVYVQTFPAPGGKWQVSTNGGVSPHWRSDGKELFYISGDNKLMAVQVNPGSSFEAGMPKALFDLGPLRVNGSSGYTGTADGQRFLFVTQGEAPANLQFTVVTNWAAEAKK